MGLRARPVLHLSMPTAEVRTSPETLLPVPSGGLVPVTFTIVGLASRLRLRLDNVERLVEELVQGEEAAAPVLHRLHRDLRRLRFEFQVWRNFLYHGARKDTRSLALRLRRLAQLVGEVRDFDVGLELIEGAASSPSSAETTAILAGTRHRMEDDAHLGRELLRAYIRTERDSGLFASTRTSLGARTRSTNQREFRRRLHRIQRRHYRALRDAGRETRETPSATRLHRLRSRLRRMRYFVEMVSQLEGHPPARLARPLRRLEGHLGDHNDLTQLLQHVDRQGPEIRDAPWVKQLRKKRRQTYRSLVHELDRRRVRAAMKQLKTELRTP